MLVGDAHCDQWEDQCRTMVQPVPARLRRLVTGAPAPG